MEKENGLLQGICKETQRALSPIKWDERFYLGVSMSRKNKTFNVVQCKHEGQNGWHSTMLLHKLHRKIPGAKFKQDKLIMPASDKTALVMHHACKNGTVKWKDETVFLHYKSLLMQWSAYVNAAKKQAAFKISNEIDDIALSFPSPPGITPGLYQRAAASCAVSVPGYAFYMEQGAGKTFCSIMAMEYMARKYKEQQLMLREKDPNAVIKPFHVVITVPLSVIMNWENELNKFSCDRGMVTILSGNRVKRVKQLLDVIVSPSTIDEPYSGYDWTASLLSYGLMKNDISNLLHVDWGLGILDESHLAKNGAAGRTKAAIKLRSKCRNRIIMTGTPIPNTPKDLYSQLEFLGDGFSGHPTVKAFGDAYQNGVSMHRNGNGGVPIERFTSTNNVGLLQEKLSMVSFNITKREAIRNLPDKTYDIVGIQMAPAQAKYYKKAMSNVVVECQDLVDSAEGAKEQAMVLQNVLKRMLRLSQITSGFFVTDALCDDYGKVIVESETHRFDPNPKLEALIDILKPKPYTDKTICWSNWVQDRKTISARLIIEGIKHVQLHGDMNRQQRQDAMNLFNEDPETMVLVGNQAVGGVGVNLLGHSGPKTNCTQAIYYCQNFDGAVRPQSEDRHYRKGTRVHVQITDLVTPNTIDQMIYETVLKKRSTARDIQNVSEMFKELQKKAIEL